PKRREADQANCDSERLRLLIRKGEKDPSAAMLDQTGHQILPGLRRKRRTIAELIAAIHIEQLDHPAGVAGIVKIGETNGHKCQVPSAKCQVPSAKCQVPNKLNNTNGKVPKEERLLLLPLSSLLV